MDIKQLKTFLAVAKHRHFHEAARELFLSQPTVSKHIRQLEEALGCLLFERSGKRVSLTPVGEQFYEHATRFVEEAERLARSVESWRQGYRSRLRVAASPMVARTFLPNVISRFASAHPDVELSVLVTESLDIAVALEQRRADIGLSRTPPRSESDMPYELLYEEPIVLVAPSDGGDGDSTISVWEEIVERLPILSHNHPDYWDRLLLLLRERGLNYRNMRVTQIDITLRFVERGLGVSFLPYSAVSDAIVEHRVQEVPAPDLKLPMTATYAVVPRRSRRSETEAFLDILRETHLAPGYA